VAQCTATVRRTGERCRRRAVTGYNVCQVHGAGSPKKGRPGGRPIVHGRYSKKLPERLRERYEESLSDSELLSLRHELALCDSRLEDLLGRVDSGESGATWVHAQKTLYAFLKEFYSDGEHVGLRLDELKQAIQKGLDDYAAWGEIQALLEQRRKIVESEQKRLVALQQVITVEKAMLLFGAITDVIKRNVTDRHQLAAISHELAGLLEKQRKEEPVEVLTE